LQVAQLQIVAPFWKERARESDHLLHRHVWIQFLVFGDEADAAADRDAVVRIERRETQHARRSRVGSEQAHQRFDGGGFPRAVASEETEDAASRNFEIQPV
jgi:hypothetical protein